MSTDVADGGVAAGRDTWQGQSSRRIHLGAVEIACIGCLVVVLIVVVAGPLLAPYNPNAVDPTSIGMGPSGAHLLGTDDVGRDLLSRLLVGARPTLIGAAVVIALATLMGTFLAFSAAWSGGAIDWTIARVFDILFAFPGLLLAILATAVFGTGLLGPVIALSIAYTPYIGRVVRSAALRERRLPYIEAASIQGASGYAIAFRHLLPNVAALSLVQATVNFGYAVIDLAAISFLGLGVQPPTADWGEMISEGQQGLLTGQPYEAIWAGCAIVLTVLAVNLLGQRLAARLGSRS
jgi:peptide/nickel transport system permease protein